MTVIHINTLLENLNDYVGQDVTVEGKMTSMGRKVSFLRDENASRIKLRPDENTIFLNIQERELAYLLSNFYRGMYPYSPNPYEVRDGLSYHVPMILTGRVELVDWSPLRTMLTDITYIRAIDESVSKAQSYPEQHPLIYEAYIEYGEFTDSKTGEKFSRSIRKKKTFSRNIQDYLNDKNLHTEHVFDKYEDGIVSVSGEPVTFYFKESKKTHLAIGQEKKRGEGQLIWLRPETEYPTKHITLRHMIGLGGPIDPKFLLQAIGRLTPIPIENGEPVDPNSRIHVVVRPTPLPYKFKALDYTLDDVQQITVEQTYLTNYFT